MTQRDIKKIDKTILDNFYKLVHSQENVRITAASSSFKILSTMKKRSQPDKFNENLNYCVDRLVAGLASSRALARKGYGTLLLELLRSFNISTERLLTIAQQKFGHISKETQRDELLAYFLLVSVILESGNYKKSKSNLQNLEKIFKILCLLLQVKSYLDYPVCSLIVKHHSLLHSHMLETIDPQMYGSDSKASAKDLLIMVLCNKVEPIRALLNLDSATLTNLYIALLDEKLQKRPLHPVFSEVGQFIIKHYPSQFEKFYNDVIRATFFKANHNELATMGIELTSELLESAENTDAIKILLDKHLIRLLITSLRSRNSLQSSCQKFFASLENHFKKIQTETDETKPWVSEKQKTILYALTSSPGSISFDEDSRSSSITNLLQHCHRVVLKDYLLTRLLSLFHGRQDKNVNPHLHLSCAKQIAFIIRRPQMIEDQATLTKTAKFLLLNSMFRIRDDGSKVLDSSFWTSNSLSKQSSHPHEFSIQSFKDAYHSTLNHIISTCNAQQRIEQLKCIVDFSDKLLSCESFEHHDQLNKSNQSWQEYKEMLYQHNSLTSENDNTKLLYPITTLYLFYGLQIVEYQMDLKEQLEELNTCTEEALKYSAKKIDTSNIVWADVLTDQIIAILSSTECNAWIRKLCEKVFGSLLPFITKNSIDLLCKVLEEQEENDSDEDEHDSDDDKMEVDENESIQESSDEEKVELNGLESAKKGEKEEKEEEEEEEEEEYLDDDQMMKMDSALSQMFKFKKNKLSGSHLFKLRVIDLIEKFIKKRKNETEIINNIRTVLRPLVKIEKPPLKEKIMKIVKV